MMEGIMHHNSISLRLSHRVSREQISMRGKEGELENLMEPLKAQLQFNKEEFHPMQQY
jgi:hypothetical protein